MLAGLKNRKNIAAPPAPVKAASVDAQPFLPPYTHYQPHMLVTKDGGVMQTIRISENKSGLNYEPHDSKGGGLRDCIRRAIGTHVATANVAVWIHTLRKRRAVSFSASYQNGFAAYLNDKWRSLHGWSHQYYNEVYITLVYDGQSAKLTDKHLFKQGSTMKQNREMREVDSELQIPNSESMRGKRPECRDRSAEIRHTRFFIHGH